MKDSVTLKVNNLKTGFQTEKGLVTAVNGVSFTINPGQTLGLVGESGSGKSVTAQSILRLLDENQTKYSGEVTFNADNILNFSERQMRKIRGNNISMIFQDSMSSLNPVYTVGDQIIEVIRLHQKASKKEAYKKAIKILEKTGIPDPEKRMNAYPHQLSGGLCQRIMIAIALSCNPDFLIADEPTTALDVTIQMQILDLMEDLRNEFNMGILLITHDLGVVAEVCTHVIVMYLGEIVEEGPVEKIFNKPLHPYTKGLLESIPQIDGDRKLMLPTIKGRVPSLHDVPRGCNFAARCPFSTSKCETENPVIETEDDSHKVRCFYYKDILEGRITNDSEQPAR